ncbi:glycoside hydrolase family 79 protein [Hypoxylon sp. CO27-5]|nr:glycoside hydrolase family 79 protein [Hypoxylon sp. CO27-5]
MTFSVSVLGIPTCPSLQLPLAKPPTGRPPNTQNISYQTTSANISPPIDPSFAGFSIEPSNIFSFMGAAEPNTFTLNLLNNLAKYTGKPSHIRIGGNTQDYMIYQECQDKWAWVENHNADGQGTIKPDSMLIGPRFFEAANRLPKGTTVTWGLNMAYEQNDYIKQITTMAKKALSNCPNLNITSFEIGNEPDLYTKNGFRAGDWRGKVYTRQWLDRASAIHKQVLLPKGIHSNFFEAAATASTIGADFQIVDLEGFGIYPKASNAPISYLSGWNQHDYLHYHVGVSEHPLTLKHIMKLRTTEDQLAAWAEQLKQAQKTRYPYALCQTGIVGPLGHAGITDFFGAALWTFNFLFCTASMGVASVGFHMTATSNASAWQPIPTYGLQPHVRPQYYSIAAFDQVIGRSPTAQVSQCPITEVPAGYKDFLRAYSVYQRTQLSSVVVINAKMANSSQTKKDGVVVQLQLPNVAAGGTVYLSYLTSKGADATANTTWNGISFELSGDGTPRQVSGNEQTVQIADDGTASFPVRDSEAVVASLGRRVGSGTGMDASSCPGTTRNEADDLCPSASSSGTSNADSMDNLLGVVCVLA